MNKKQKKQSVAIFNINIILSTRKDLKIMVEPSYHGHKVNTDLMKNIRAVCNIYLEQTSKKWRMARMPFTEFFLAVRICFNKIRTEQSG